LKVPGHRLRHVPAGFNNIDLKTKVYPGDIKGRIRQSFKRHANVDADSGDRDRDVRHQT
jgi:hypothetical protein